MLPTSLPSKRQSTLDMEEEQNASNVSSERALGRLESGLETLLESRKIADKLAGERHHENKAAIDQLTHDTGNIKLQMQAFGKRMAKVESITEKIEGPADAFNRARRFSRWFLLTGAGITLSLLELVHNTANVVEFVKGVWHRWVG